MALDVLYGLVQPLGKRSPLPRKAVKFHGRRRAKARTSRESLADITNTSQDARRKCAALMSEKDRTVASFLRSRSCKKAKFSNTGISGCELVGSAQQTC